MSRASIRGWLAVVLVGVAAAASRADWFEDMNGGIVQPWVFLSDNTAVGNPGHFTVDDSEQELRYRGSYPDLLNLGQADAFVVGFVNGDGLSDATIVGEVRSLTVPFPAANTIGNNDIPLALRLNPQTLESYLFNVDFNNGAVDIVRVDLGPDVNGVGASETLPGFNKFSAYFLEFTALGDTTNGVTLRGKVFDAPGGNLLLQMERTDSTPGHDFGAGGTIGAINDSSSIGGVGVARTLVAAAFDNVGYFTPGNFNRDGVINAQDYLEWEQNYGRFNASIFHGDANGDSLVSGADYTLWADNLPSLAGPVAVPEPASCVLLAVGGAVLWAGARRRIRR